MKHDSALSASKLCKQAKSGQIDYYIHADGIRDNADHHFNAKQLL